ncbi:sulfurtransferase [Dyella sp.]|jgi:thiosulfate/3-mercaptopyruvate sulfurtransferase|uniref:sulfurtransferase n=1 Tax=Dyella sp. TaxID=1869338 RepID=UPI002D7A2F9C|nr:sulfurtransferase [Dyella sp.]HET6433039.1 sulfurtransferase [Dyella sp.]
MSLKTTLIDAADVAAIPPSELLIVDCRFDLADPGQGRRDFLAGHIPGAVYADLDQDLSDLSRQHEGLGRHPLPSLQALSAHLARWGWRPRMQVVCYDAAGGALAAARLWWLLRLGGVREVAVLDGGLAAWKAAGLSLATGDQAARASGPVVLKPDPHASVDHAGAAAAAAAGLLVDARAEPRYRGEVEPIDTVAGHVPGALNRPFALNLGAEGRFKPAEALRREWLALLGERPPETVVHMCGSGVTAAHNVLAMEHAGLAGSRLYPPSWSGWISDGSRPVARGSD